jgi:hypothetical protein
VAVYRADGGYYLLRYDEADTVVADTWHESLAKAKTQARREYGIEENDWTVAPIALEAINPRTTPDNSHSTGF